MSTGRPFVWVNKNERSKTLSRSEGREALFVRKQAQAGLPRLRKHNASVEIDSHESPSRLIKYPRGSTAPELSNPVARSIACTSLQTGPVHIDGTIRRFIHYYTYHYRPTILTCSKGRGQYISTQEVTTTISNAVRDEVLMYCLLSASASRLENLDAPQTLPSQQEQYRYKQSALTLVRQRVEKGSSSSCTYETLVDLVRCITFLGAAASYRNDYDEAAMHLQTALKLLYRRGGIMQVPDQNLQAQLSHMDLYLACIYMRPCFSRPDYDPGPVVNLSLPDDELFPVHNPYVASALLECDTTLVPPELRELVLQICEAYSVTDRFTRGLADTSRQSEVSNWIMRRNMAIRNRLLALDILKITNATTHALRISLTTWTLLSNNITSKVKTVKVLASRLKGILRGIPNEQWTNNRYVRFWILLVGFHSADEDGSDWSWFVEQIHAECGALFPLMGCQDDMCSALEDFQARFFYNGSVQHAGTEQLAQMLSSSFDTKGSC